MAPNALLEAQARQVRDIVDKPLHHILSDLKFTGSVDATVNRIMEGRFLEGTDRDPAGVKKLWDAINDDGNDSDGLEILPPNKNALHPTSGNIMAPRCYPGDFSDEILFKSSPVIPAKRKQGTAMNNNVICLLSDDDEPIPQKPSKRRTSEPLKEKPKPSLLREESVKFLGIDTIPTKKPKAAVTEAKSRLNQFLPQSKKQLDAIEIGDSDDDLELASVSSVKQTTTSITNNKTSTSTSTKRYSESTAAILAAYTKKMDSDSDTEKPRKKKSSKSKSSELPNRQRMSASIDRESSAGATSKPKRSRLTDEEKASKEAAKEAAAKEREVARKTKADEKEAAKQVKAAEKAARDAAKREEADILSVNKLRNSKKESVPEMIVDMSSGLANLAMGEQLKGFLTNLGCSVTTDLPSLNLPDKIVKWRRKSRAFYSEEKGMFVPYPDGREEILDESHILVHLTAAEFVSLAFPESAELDVHVLRISSLLPNAKIMYMLEGMIPYLRKSTASKNREFQAAARAALSGTTYAPALSRSPVITEDDIEDRLLHLQLVHNCLIHQTSGPTDSAEWIATFTSEISSIPYKNARAVNKTDSTFLGGIRAGSDRKDTMSRMLQTITRVTAPVADGILAEVGGILGLVRRVESQGEGALQDITFVNLANGALNEKRVGLAMSRKIAGVFLGRDPAALVE